MSEYKKPAFAGFLLGAAGPIKASQDWKPFLDILPDGIILHYNLIKVNYLIISLDFIFNYH
jgi:hypothetical protein